MVEVEWGATDTLWTILCGADHCRIWAPSQIDSCLGSSTSLDCVHFRGRVVRCVCVCSGWCYESDLKAKTGGTSGQSAQCVKTGIWVMARGQNPSRLVL